MEHPTHAIHKWLHHPQRVLETIAALMDDAIESGFGGDFELLLEDARLLLFVALIISARPLPLGTWQTIVVEAGFADGDDLGILSEFAERGTDVLRRLIGVGRMPARDGVDALVLLGEFDRPSTAF
jgi:hypothetical protein